MNPAIVAAALNQWGLLNGMQPNQGNNNDQVSVCVCVCAKTCNYSSHEMIVISLFQCLLHLFLYLSFSHIQNH